MDTSSLRKHEPRIYSGLLALTSAIRTISSLAQDDIAILMGAAGSLIITIVLFVFIWKKVRSAFIICGVYMLLSGVLGAFGGAIALASPEMFPLSLLILVYALFCLWGGYRLVRIWKTNKRV